MLSDALEDGGKFDAFFAVVLGIAAIAAAWSAFQSGSLGGDAQTLQNQSITTTRSLRPVLRYGAAVVGLGILAVAIVRVVDLGYYGGM